MLISSNQDEVDAVAELQRARRELLSKIKSLTKTDVPALPAYLLLEANALSERIALIVWHSRGDTSTTDIDGMLNIPGACAVDTVLSCLDVEGAGMADFARVLRRDLATTNVKQVLIRLQDGANCGPISFAIAAVAIHRRKLCRPDIDACVEFGSRLGSAVRKRHRHGTDMYLSQPEVYSFLGGVLDESADVTATCLRQGDLFQYDCRRRITSVLESACNEGRNVWVGES